MTSTKLFKASEMPPAIRNKLAPYHAMGGSIFKYPHPFGWLDEYPSHEEFISARNKRADLDQWFFENGANPNHENQILVEWDM